MSASKSLLPARDWIVLGDRDHGISYGPFTQAEAQQFAADWPGRMALPMDGACSQIETCVAYGLPFKPRCRATSPEGERCKYRSGHDSTGQPHSWTLFGFGGPGRV